MPTISHPLKSGIWTMEWWGLLATLAGQVITLLVLFGWVKPQNEESLTKAISAIIATIGAMGMQWAAYYGFNNGRVILKRDAIKNPEIMNMQPVEDSKPSEPVDLFASFQKKYEEWLKTNGAKQ